MPTVLNEAPYAAAFLIREGNGSISRDTGTIANTGATELVLEAGTVLGRLTADGTHVAYDNTGTDGSETAAAILLHPVVVPAGSGRRATLIVRHAEVNGSELVFVPAVDAAGRTAAAADLKPAAVIVR